jgi:hypothetical protein
LSELRQLRRLGYLDDFTDIGKFGEDVPLPPRGGTRYNDPEVGPRGAGDGYPPRSTLTTDVIRNIPGVVRGGRDLPNIYGQWLRNGQGSIPGQIGRKLEGRKFASWHDFRAEFWRLVEQDPILRQQFRERNLALMRSGQAPLAPTIDQQGKKMKFEIHHIVAIENGGGVYDLHNLIVVSPRRHHEIHYGP